MSYTFQGYRRANGKFGARNLVAVIPSVICANDVGQAICRQVQGTIGYFHHQGCCQLPLDLRRVTDTLSNLGQSPNVGAALIVSLGCEGTDHERLVEEIRATGKPVEIIRIQELGGTSRAHPGGHRRRAEAGAADLGPAARDGGHLQRRHGHQVRRVGTPPPAWLPTA